MCRLVLQLSFVFSALILLTVMMYFGDTALGQSRLGLSPAAEEGELPGRRGPNYRPRLGTSLCGTQEGAVGGSTVWT